MLARLALRFNGVARFFSFSVESWAKARVRQIEPRCGAFWKEPDGDNHKIHITIISHEVTVVFATINEG